MTIENKPSRTASTSFGMRPASSKGAAFYEQDVIRDDGVIISVKQGDAQPVAVLSITRASMSRASSAASGGTPLRWPIERRRTARRKPTCSASPASETAIRLASPRLMPKQTRCGPNRSVESAEAHSARAHRRTTHHHAPPWTARATRRHSRRAASRARRRSSRAARHAYTRRDHPLVAMVQQAFGWTDAEVDALFAEADLV